MAESAACGHGQPPVLRADAARIRLPSMLTIRVIARRTSAAYISALRSTAAGLGEIGRQQRGQRIGGREQGQADLVGVADQHGQRHRLAERAPEAQHQRAEDAASRGRQHHPQDRLPPGRAHAVGGFLGPVGDLAQRILRDRGDGRQDHDREHDRCREAGPARSARCRRAGTSRDRRAASWRSAADARDDDEDAPQTEHDARDRGQHLDRRCETRPPVAACRKSWVRKIATVMPKNPPISSASSELYSVPQISRQDAESRCAAHPRRCRTGSRRHTSPIAGNGLPCDLVQDVGDQQHDEPRRAASVSPVKVRSTARSSADGGWEIDLDEPMSAKLRVAAMCSVPMASDRGSMLRQRATRRAGNGRDASPPGQAPQRTPIT